MKETFIVGGNAFTVSAPESLRAWTAIRPRFREFSAPEEWAGEPALEAEIKSEPLPERAGEKIYEPEHAEVGLINAAAWRLSDGAIVTEFSHIEETRPRLWMKMPPALDRAEIVLAPDGDANDTYFISHALMIAYMLATTGNGTLLIHASAVVKGGRAYLFQGKSGTGKSTHARLWVENIEGAELLNDDNPVIRISEEGVAMAYGSPWSGKTHCYRNLSARVGAFVRIVRAPENKLKRLTGLRAYASLTSSMFYMPFLSEEQRARRHKEIERLAGEVACCEMHCRPDADAALTCLRGLMIYANN